MLSRRGFTLIELLAVVAILAALMAILFPVFAQAREQARAIACLSNTRQIAGAALLYAQDYDEALIPWRSAQDSQPLDVQIGACWVNTVQPYVKNGQILWCPSFSADRTAEAIDTAGCDGDGTPGSGSAGFVPPAQYLSHYGIGMYLVFGTCTPDDPYAFFPGSGWQNSGYPGLPGGTVQAFYTSGLAGVPQPARTAFVGDGVTVVRSDAPAVGTLFGCEGRLRHKGSGANLGFLDGHATYVVGNPESYIDQDPNDGCWFERYFAANR